MKDLFTKIQSILIYYDSEPMELFQGFIWLIVYPILNTLDHGLSLVIIPSILIGLGIIKSVCCFSIRFRKTMAFAAFLFSTIVVTLSFFHEDLPYSVMHWVWVLIALNSIINLKIITNRYYIVENGTNR